MQSSLSRPSTRLADSGRNGWVGKHQMETLSLQCGHLAAPCRQALTGVECHRHRLLPSRSPALCRPSTCKCGLFFFNQLKCALGIHGEIDWCLVHVDDITPVVICLKDDAAHEHNEVDKSRASLLALAGTCCNVCVLIR